MDWTLAFFSSARWTIPREQEQRDVHYWIGIEASLPIGNEFQGQTEITPFVSPAPGSERK